MQNMKLPAPSIEAFNQSRSFQVGGYEVFEDYIYDTVTYLAAGSATLDVFTTQTNDETLSNLKQPGQIPKPDKFHAYKLFVVPLVDVTSEDLDVAAGRARDISRVFFTSRGILKMTPSTTGRTRTGIPLWSLGQPNPMRFDATGTSAAHLSKVLGTTGAVGYPFELALDSTEEIRGQLKFGNAQAITADLPLVIALYGWRFKKTG